jgi:hypothetical protein
MNDKETIDNHRFQITPRVAISVLIASLVVSNTFTKIHSNIEANTLWVEYNNEASKRRLENAVIIQDLKNELKLCQNK